MGKGHVWVSRMRHRSRRYKTREDITSTITGVSTRSRKSGAGVKYCTLTTMMQTCQVPRLALGVMMVLFAASAYGSNECTQEKIAECTTMIGNMTDGADILTKSNAEQMRTVCRNYGKFETCIAPLKPTCSTTQMNQIEAFNRVFSFLCDKKNLNDYVKHADCFSKMNMEKTTATCITTFKSDANAAKGSKTRLCQIIGDYVNCVVKPVSSNCGDDAARYIRRMFVYFMKPSLDLIDCDISGGRSRVGNSVMVTVLAVMVLPVLTLLGV